MLDFRKIRIEDKPEIDYYLKNYGFNTTESCFTALFLWQKTSGISVAFDRDCVYFLCENPKNNAISYLMPYGAEITEKNVEILFADAHRRGVKLCINQLTEQSADTLNKFCPNMFEYSENRNGFDYIYNSQDLINLTGKSFHSKRNFINRFIQSYAGKWVYEAVNDNNISEAANFVFNWIENKENNLTFGFEHEMNALKLLFDNYNKLEVSGGILRVEGKIVAFTCGSEINKDTFCVHFEKADTEIIGAYPMINREFASAVCGNYKFINREDDLGIEGLRKAKLSYNPCTLAKKICAVEI